MTPEQRAVILTAASIATDATTPDDLVETALEELRATLDDVQADRLEFDWEIHWQTTEGDTMVSYADDEEDARKRFLAAPADMESFRARYRSAKLCRRSVARGDWRTVEEYRKP